MTETNVPDRKATLPCTSCGKLNRVRVERIRQGPRCGSCAQPLVLDRPLTLTDATFDQVVSGSDLAVVVDFYADWCQPCKIMAPLFDQIAREKAGLVVVAKLDTQRHQQTAARFAIRGIPTTIAFVRGAEAGREVGAVPKPRLSQLVETAIVGAGR